MLGPFPPRRVVPSVLAIATLSLALGCSHLVDRSNAGIPFLEEAAPVVSVPSTAAKYLGWVSSAPLVLALTPVAAVAWATPWVDLPLAVDIASAPAIGLGYAFEGIVGLPLHGALSWIVPRRETPSLEPLQPPRKVTVPWGFIVEHRPAPPEPRPARPLAPELAEYYAVPEEAVGDLERQLRVHRGDEPSRARLPLPDLAGSLEFYAARESAGNEPRPLVLMTPPTRATFSARYLARRYARRGVHAAVVVPDEEFLETRLDARGVEAKFRAGVVSARAALAALAEVAEVAEDEVFVLGISAGGIFGAVLLAVEPRVRRAVLVLPGGDLPRIIAESDESTVVAYRESWAARGVPPADLAASFARELRTDPSRLASHVDPRDVLMFLGAWDSRVPIATGLELRDALGRPETYLVAGNHETAAVCFGFILRRTDEFLFGGDGA